jgi:thiol-disulfide isomerase/thioredoxin
VKTIKIIRSGLAITLMLLAPRLQAQYNANPTLKIGDNAPPLIVQSWVKGNSIKEFEKGKVYVIDFWATWCGGCIASFPHISAIAKKYEGKVRFASIDSYEDVGDNKDADPVVSVQNFLKTPKGQKLKIDVAVDGKSNTMYTTWVKPLRRQGFPTTFIIDQNGKIAFIDVNLDNLDWAIGQVLAKKWDNEKEAKMMHDRDAIEDLLFGSFKNEQKDQKFLGQMLDASNAFEKEFPDRKDLVNFYKFWAISDLDKEKVPELLEEMAANPRSKYINLDDAVQLTLRRTDLSKRDYQAVAKAQERLIANDYNGTGHGGKTVKTYSDVADTYSKAGNSAMAVSSIQKAITIAKVKKVPANEMHKLNSNLNKYRASSVASK